MTSAAISRINSAATRRPDTVIGMRRMVDAGGLGRKSGRGFYTYT